MGTEEVCYVITHSAMAVGGCLYFNNTDLLASAEAELWQWVGGTCWSQHEAD